MKFKSFCRKYIFFFLFLIIFINGIFSQPISEREETTFWSLNAGITLSEIIVDGFSAGLIIEPRFNPWPNIFIGSRSGLSLSTDKIIALDTQVYLRWKFLSFDIFGKTTDAFVQGGVGFLGALKGPYDHFDIRDSRSSVLGDITAGITVPLTQRWQIEPSISGGYPFILAFNLTTGYKFPLKTTVVRTERVIERVVETVTETVVETVIQTVIETQYIEVAGTTPAEVVVITEPIASIITEPQRVTDTERVTDTQRITDTERVIETERITDTQIITRTVITQSNFILFGADSPIFNYGIDSDARSLNELVINSVTQMLRNNPDYKIRIEGNANPVSHEPGEPEILYTLSQRRAEEVARLLRLNGIEDERIIIIVHGGTRTLASDHAHWNMNRRVELIIFQE